MSGFAELRDLGVTFRPPDSPLPPEGGTYSPFEASWSVTVELLARELRNLHATTIVVELDLSEGDLRVDGLPRANARIGSDAIRISFQSKHGPLRYETGQFASRGYRGLNGWQSNIRAVALALEALRKVDRYGVSTRGEQYKGWGQLPMSTDPADAIQTREQAQKVINFYGGDIRTALRATHPDRGGDETEFRKVMRAKEVLGV